MDKHTGKGIKVHFNISGCPIFGEHDIIDKKQIKNEKVCSKVSLVLYA